MNDKSSYPLSCVGSRLMQIGNVGKTHNVFPSPLRHHLSTNLYFRLNKWHSIIYWYLFWKFEKGRRMLPRSIRLTVKNHSTNAAKPNIINFMTSIKLLRSAKTMTSIIFLELVFSMRLARCFSTVRSEIES